MVAVIVEARQLRCAPREGSRKARCLTRLRRGRPLEPTPTTPVKSSRTQVRSAKKIRFQQERLLKLAGMTLAPPRIINQHVWVVCLCCMADTTGREIERQLEAFRPQYARWVLDLALREHWAGYARTWEDWRARRLAVELIFFGLLAQRSKYHGEEVWMVRGIPRGAIAWASQRHTMIGGKAYNVEPHFNSVYSDLCELVESGILLPPAQFSQDKVPPWTCGAQKKDRYGNLIFNKDGSPMRWAMNHYFLTEAPFDRAPRKVYAVPMGAPMHPARRRQPQREPVKPSQLDSPAAALAHVTNVAAQPAPAPDAPASEEDKAREEAVASMVAMGLLRARPPPDVLH